MSELARLAIDHSEQMMFLVEADSLRIVLANRAAASALGYADDALLGKSILDVESALPDVFYWEEVRSGLDLAAFTMDVVLERVARDGDLFERVLQGGQSLGAALRALR